MTKDTLLFTGATGMIGFRTLILLLEQGGFNVRVAVRSQSSYNKLLSYKPLAPYKSQLESAFVSDITVPAIQGTVGILECAHKAGGVKKIVITASLVAIATSEYMATGATINEGTRVTDTKRPFANPFAAYTASKALSFQATDDFVAKQKPSFNIVRILPVFVIGRDDTATDVSHIAKGTNGLVMGPLLGYAREGKLSGGTVHVDDVAKLHILALDPAISDNQDFLASNPAAIEWTESFVDIVKRKYPAQYAAGLFKFDSVAEPESGPSQVDTTKATKTFGIQFKSFEEQVTSVVDHYLELAGAS